MGQKVIIVIGGMVQQQGAQEQRQTDGDQGNRQTAPAIALQAEEEKGQKCQEQEKQEYQEAGTGRALGQ